MNSSAFRPLFYLLILAFLCNGSAVGQTPSSDRFPELQPKSAGKSRWKPIPQEPTAQEPTAQKLTPQKLTPQKPGEADEEPQSTTQPLAPSNITWDPKPVAELTWQAGPRTEFVIHATLPVPQTFELAPNGFSTIGIRPKGLDSAPTPAQVHVVARNAQGQIQVIEILAPMRMPIEVHAGSLHRFEVLMGSFPLPQPRIEPASVSTLFQSGTSPYLTTIDVFGNSYRFDLNLDLEAKGVVDRSLLKSGHASRQWKLAGALMPVATTERGAPLPHMMAVHAYLTTWHTSKLVSLDLRIHNGLTAASGKSTPFNKPLGTVYWKSIDLHLPPGWKPHLAVHDPFLGKQVADGDGWTRLPLVRALPDGKLHMMGPQAQLLRRLTLRGPGSETISRAGVFVEGLAFCSPGRDLWSWFTLPAYFSQDALLPTFEGLATQGLAGYPAMEGRLVKERNHLLHLLRSGNSDGNLVQAEVMGWSHPRGDPQQGMVSGVDIAFLEGHRTAWAASHAGYERLQLLHRMNAARQPDAQWNEDGTPAGVHAWRDKKGVVPFDFRTNGYMVPPEFQYVCRGGPAPSAHVREVHKLQLRPPYDQGNAHEPAGKIPRNKDAMFAWMPHDGQHMIRHTKNIKALVWLSNDSLARDDLMHCASLFRLMFHAGPHVRESWSAGVTLKAVLGWAKTSPHHGIPIDRDQAWGLDIMGAAYRIASPAWRQDALPWFQKVVELFDVASMPSGLIQRVNQSDLLEGRFDCCQSFQVMFLLHAMRCINESVLRGVDEESFDVLAKLHNKSLEYMFFGPVYTHFKGERWGGPVSQAGPFNRFAVAPKGLIATVPYSNVKKWGSDYLPPGGHEPYVDTTYLLPPLEYGFLLTYEQGQEPLQNRYLKRSLATGSVPGSWAKMKQEYLVSLRYPHTDNSNNTGSFIALLQSLGAF
ncbi:MAG: hypothetical protein ACI9X4_002222 [Glaciecola sp.]|jgi:hypothetical protein